MISRVGVGVSKGLTEAGVGVARGAAAAAKAAAKRISGRDEGEMISDEEQKILEEKLRVAYKAFEQEKSSSTYQKKLKEKGEREWAQKLKEYEESIDKAFASQGEDKNKTGNQDVYKDAARFRQKLIKKTLMAK